MITKIRHLIDKAFYSYRLCGSVYHNFKLTTRHGNRHGLWMSWTCTMCGTTLDRFDCPSISSDTWTDKNGKILNEQVIHIYN
jgi:hypothetical protein